MPTPIRHPCGPCGTSHQEETIHDDDEEVEEQKKKARRALQKVSRFICSNADFGSPPIAIPKKMPMSVCNQDVRSMIFTLWFFNIAMENNHFYRYISISMGHFPARYVSHNQRVFPIKHIIKHYYGIFMVFNLMGLNTIMNGISP